jgi:hypothetical protein
MNLPGKDGDSFIGKFAPMYGGCLLIWFVPYLLVGAVWFWARFL